MGICSNLIQFEGQTKGIPRTPNRQTRLGNFVRSLDTSMTHHDQSLSKDLWRRIDAVVGEFNIGGSWALILRSKLGKWKNWDVWMWLRCGWRNRLIYITLAMERDICKVLLRPYMIYRAFFFLSIMYITHTYKNIYTVVVFFGLHLQPK